MKDKNSIEYIIYDIESLFPADSGYTGTATLGKALLEQAMRNVNYRNDWRTLPENVLREYHRLCIEENSRQERAMSKF